MRGRAKSALANSCAWRSRIVRLSVRASRDKRRMVSSRGVVMSEIKTRSPYPLHLPWWAVLLPALSAPRGAKKLCCLRRGLQRCACLTFSRFYPNPLEFAKRPILRKRADWRKKPQLRQMPARQYRRTHDLLLPSVLLKLAELE